MPIRALVIRPPGEPERVGRTLRALEAAGVTAEEAGTDLARAVGSAEGSTWLVRAGAWPASPGPISEPPPSATGKPLVAFGATLVEGRADPGLIASIYLDPEPLAELASRLGRGEPLDQTIRGLLEEVEGRRVVRFGSLDVRHDAGLRVLQVVTSLQRGGAERVTLDLAVALGWHGVRSRVVTLSRPTRQAFESPRDSVDLSALGRNYQARTEGVAQEARDFAADVVHGHLLNGEEARLVASQGVPLVLTIHNQRPGWPLGLERLEAGDAALLVACARAVEAELVGAGLPIPIRTAWNGIDPGAFAPDQNAAGQAFRDRLGLGPTDFVLLALANPRPQKRLDRLPGILLALRDELALRGIEREARVVIVGEASPSSPGAIEAVRAVAEEVDRLMMGDHIRWAGPVDRVAEALAGSDVLISTSDHEGLSLAQIEALAAGVPVVSTDVGGASELAPGDPSVTLVPINAPPERFAEILADRAGSPIPVTLRADFTRSTMAARYAWLYPRAIAHARRRTGGDGLLLITNNFSIGGAQTSARRLLIGLAGEGVRVRSVVLQEQPDHPTPGRAALVAAGIPVHAMQPAGSIDPVLAVDRLLGHVFDEPPAAVLLWNVIPEYRVLIADGLIDVPLFDVSPGALSFDALDRYFIKPRAGLPYRSAAEYGARLSGAIVKYQDEANRAASTLRTPIFVIPNGVPVDVSPRRPAGDRVIIGTSARIHPQKRLELLIEALRLAHDSMPRYVLRIAGGVERGSEAYAESLRRLADGLDVEWLGSLDDTTEFLRDLDFFVMVAEPAGCPNASLEAMAAGLAVVATDAGGMAEQVDDGVNGRLVGRDDVVALASAIVELARDSSLREAQGIAGRSRAVERFGMARMIDSYRRVCL
jgi:glycosyltransferase involved in cell wall biosynthesis